MAAASTSCWLRPSDDDALAGTPRREEYVLLPSREADSLAQARAARLPLTRRRRPVLAQRLRADFLTGIVVVLPAGLTAMVVLWAVGFIDATVAPFLPDWLLVEHVKGMGLALFAGLAVLVGRLAKGYAGRRAVRSTERLLARLPVVRSVHAGLKEIVEAAIGKSGTSFRQVCLLEYPERGIWTPVVIATEAEGEVAWRTGRSDLVAVLVPTAPNPITGFLIFAARSDLVPLDLSLEDAAKLVMSAGLVSPADLDGKTATEPAPKGKRPRSRATVA